MTDGGKTKTLSGVLGWVNGGLHLIEQGAGRRFVVGCHNDQLDGAANGQLLLACRRIDRREPSRSIRIQSADYSRVPCCHSGVWDKVGGVYTPIPDGVHLDSADTLQSAHLFGIVRLVAAKRLRLETVKHTLAESFRFLLIVTGDKQLNQFRMGQAVHIFNRDESTGIIISSSTGRFTGHFMAEASVCVGGGAHPFCHSKV